MYIVMTAAAEMPSTCWGTYRRIAVVEIEGREVPKMISPRARGVIRIVQSWERLNVGKTNRSAYAKALAEANELCDRLNAPIMGRPKTGFDRERDWIKDNGY